MDAPTASRTAAKDTTARYFTYKEILEITGHFGDEKPTSIYSGRLRGGPEVAVKKLGESGTDLGKLHAEEIKILMRIRHPNLVSLLGSCEERQIILVYEKYMACGSLFEQLKGDGTLRELTWKKRLHIALGAARGLAYLHTGCKPPIVHGDITSANILLNEKLEAKLANFGLSKAEERGENVGTEGYVDPEYFCTGKLDKMSDVYSFGIVLFELITGKPAAMFPHEPKNKLLLAEWIVPKLESGERESLLDPSVKGQYNTESVREVIEIAKAAICDPSGRPDMTEIVRRLRTALRMETASVSEIVTS